MSFYDEPAPEGPQIDRSAMTIFIVCWVTLFLLYLILQQLGVTP